MELQFQAGRQELEKLWDQGVSGNELLRKQSLLVDDFVRSSFAGSGADVGFAVVALGGYGRVELYPYSDIDIMILYSPELQEQAAGVADSVLYPLWDTGLDIGHGVRTIAESIAHAEGDYLFQVSLLDARLICGDAALFADLQLAYREQFIDGCRRNFVIEMKARRSARCDRFGTHSYLLEPQVKEGRGGMRDLQAMFWTARVVFGLTGLDDIAEAGLLTIDEKRLFLQSWDLLVRLRIRLHYMSGRKNDQLYFEQQLDMAEAFGYVEGGGMLPVEAFMRDLYSHLQNIALVTDLFFDHIDETLGLDTNMSDFQDRLIEKGIEVRQGRIHLVADGRQLKGKPHILIRVFLVMARMGLPLHYRTRKLIAANMDLITDKVRRSPRMVKPFLALFDEAKDIFSVLNVMLETGMLPTFLPEFTQVVSLAQHDLYHIYTVDRHSLQTVSELRDVFLEFPQVAALVEEKSLLYLAALLHDIGKGSGRDHSEEGALLVGAVAERFALAGDSADDLSFLVRYHLFIPENALRRDLNDAAFIQRCAETVGTLPRLAMLYLLSVSDSRATGPSAWSDWKASLMHEMYLKVLSAIENQATVSCGDDLQEQVDQGVEWLRSQVQEKIDTQGLFFDLAVLPADYLLAFSSEDVLAHVQLCLQHQRLLRQKSLVKVFEGEDDWKILLMSHDRPGLLAKLCGVLALHNLAVAMAQIFTWEDGVIVDVVTVRPQDGAGFSDKDWDSFRADIDLALSHRLDLGHKLYQKWQTTYGRKAELVGAIDPRVVVDNESSDTYSVLEVYAVDRPHLLYHLAQTLADFGVNIYKAYIATEVEQLIDVFYVLDSRGEKLLGDSLREDIVQALCKTLSKTEL
ncbi:[protein-PII] uridylyltransferase [Desulfotalea psychrophila]|uniref:Bifunctional uridylyltransferase/uridylyl-removing enzyme n=1 Tax=Desulfotalea psychrophila (strain LSv54 / DSM 12343) TaxID=177439 RepID=Q6APR6_DESPS|nr:[protein-PII] uridylyltransferase [Desulfotalea psychrophila]CAG35658.1 probable [Protein-PII] uridylyltransferase [Desulfotalea psychrophila LSv54]